MDATFDGDRIVIDGNEHRLEKKIRKVVPLDDKVVVLFRHGDYDETDFSQKRNVIALDRRGKMLWRIQESSEWVQEGKELANPYIGVGFRDEGERIVACDMGGMDADLDPETGTLSNIRFSK